MNAPCWSESDGTNSCVLSAHTRVRFHPGFQRITPRRKGPGLLTELADSTGRAGSPPERREANQRGRVRHGVDL